MNTPEEIQAFKEEADQRFFAAATSEPPTNGQRNSVAVLRQATAELGALILEHSPKGRDQSLALTHLEDTLMRANRAIFQR